MKKRLLKNSLNVTFFAIAIIGIIVLLNILSSKFSYRKDITENRIYELSEDTLNVLSELDKSGKTINVYFFNLDSGYLDAKTENLVLGLLKQYDKTSKNLNFKSINLEKNPSYAQKYNLSSGYEVVFEMGERYRAVTLMEMFEGTSFNGEAAYTSAIKYAMNENPPVVYYIQGHKEAILESEIKYLKSEIEREGYILKTLNIALEGKVPDDASMVIDIGAKTEFSSKEADILKGYLDNGGKAIILTHAFSEESTINELNNLLKDYSVNVKNDIVIEPSRNFAGAKNIVIPVYEINEISHKLSEQKEYYMVIPDSRSIEYNREIENTRIDPLLTSTVESWGETSLEQYNNKEIARDDVDVKGPMTLAVYITRDLPGGKKSELIVVGNDLFVYDSVLNTTRSGANIEFLINSMTKLSPEQNPITIKSKPLDIKQIVLPYNKQKVLFFSLVLGIPTVILIIGLSIWLRRRAL